MRPSIVCYTTPEAIALQLDKADPGNLPAADQAAYNDFFANVNKYCREASAYITSVTDRIFVPYKYDREYPHRELYETGGLKYGRMGLGEDLFVLNSVSWLNVTLSATDYRPLPVNTLPYDSVRFSSSANLSFTPSDFSASTIVSGTWGYHTNVSDAYTTVSTAITLANATDTTITVLDASLYQTLQYVKCESELMLITARNETTDILTVARGVNGTTAAAHTAQALQRFNVLGDVAMCATRLVAYLYQKRNDVGNAVMMPDGSVNWGNIPKIIDDIQVRYTRSTWDSVNVG